MGARQRLNSLYFVGALVSAGLIGGLTNSWAVFLIAVVVLTIALIHGGNIRPQPRRSPQQRRRRW